MLLNLIWWLSLYLPFQLALNPAEGIDLASIRIFILAIFIVWLAEGFRKKSLKIYREPQTWLVVGFLFLNAFSGFFARNFDWSIRKVIFLFSIFPIYFVGRDILNSQEKALKISRSLVWSGVVAASIGIIQFMMQFIVGLDAVYNFWAHYVIIPFLGKAFSQAVLTNPSWLVGISGHTLLRATSVFPDPHMLSFYLGLLIPLCGGIFLKTKKITYLGLFFILLIGDIVTFSRGGYLGLSLGIMYIFVLIWLKINKKYKLISVFAALFLFSLVLVPSPVSERFFSSFNPKEGSNKGRIEAWEKAVEVVLDNPVFGVGIGNYPLTIKPTADYREPIYAHNAYLDIATETGVINSFIWVFFLFSSGVYFYRQKDILYSSLSVSLVVYAAHSLVEMPIYSPTVLALLLIISSFRIDNAYEKNNVS